VVGVPAYFYPWPGGSDWWQLRDLTREAIVIINPASGPGAAVDHNYEAALADLRRPPVRVLGYVDDAYGETQADAIRHQAAVYAARYAVDGIFLDRTRGDALAHRRLAPLCADLHQAGLRVALNPGQPEVDPRHLAIADHVVLFEGDLPTYRATRFPGWIHLHDRTTVWHLVHDVPQAALLEVAHLAGERHVGVLLATDRGMPQPWAALPGYWPEQPELGTPPVE
jgi:hypothetical protein